MDVGDSTVEPGSSPRVRGTQVPVRNGRLAALDHPRVCGEHTSAGTAKVTVKGSSPRVRGTPAIASGLSLGMGIIPACAGNTWMVPIILCPERDHPRVCGEHLAAYGADHKAKGSSPRVRGTPAGGPSPSPPSGIIPACAGNTRC